MWRAVRRKMCLPDKMLRGVMVVEAEGFGNSAAETKVPARTHKLRMNDFENRCTYQTVIGVQMPSVSATTVIGQHRGS